MQKKWINYKILNTFFNNLKNQADDENTKYWFKGATPDGVSEHSNGIEGTWRSVKKEFFNYKKQDISILKFVIFFMIYE